MPNFLPRDFMERVVVWPGLDGPGYINLHWKAPGVEGFRGFRGRPFKTLDDFMDLAQRAAVKPSVYQEIYFCLSTQQITGRLIHGTAIAHRHHLQALAFKSLWMDIDVKPEKGYASIKEALDGIMAFVVAANMPGPSAIVFSGGGVHVYWFSDKPLTKAEWEAYAHGLKAEMIKHGLKCDAGLTTDAARVLRVPGTFNNKLAKPRPVTLQALGASYDFATDPRFQRLASIGVVSVQSRSVTAAVTPRDAPAFDLTNFPAGGMHPALQGLLDPVNDAISGLSSRADVPLEIDEVVKGCTHFQNTFLTHGKDDPEPLWQLTLLASSFFEDGERLAHTFSKGYPTYDKGETQKKYEQKLQQKAAGNLGWPSCQAFEDAGAKCKTCPFYKRIRSPLNLAARALPPANALPLPPPDLMLPDGFILNNEGFICEIVDIKSSNGATETVYKQLFMSRLRNPICQGGAGSRAFLCETSLDQHHWGPVKLEEDGLYNDQAMLKQLRACGVKTFVKNESRVRHFVTSWMAKLDAAKARIQTVPFGWLREAGGKEIGFAYGGQVNLKDGTQQVSGYADPQMEAVYRPTGEIAQWYTALKMITDQKRPANEAIIAMSLAAPLMTLVGKNNCVVCVWSPNTASQKTTAQYIGLAIWGHPRLTKESPMSSKKGIMHKLGQLKCLPLYWDEISSDEKMDQVRDLLGVGGEGRGGTLLTQARNFFHADDWETIMLVASNRSLMQNIMRATQGTDAELERVFEFVVPPAADTMFEGDASNLIKSLEYNYGGIGLLYARYLGEHPEEVRAFANRIYEKFCKQVEHQSAGRFRAAAAACIYAGAEIANKHLGATFNLPELWDFLKTEYVTQTETISAAEIVGGTSVFTSNHVAQFFKANTRNALWVKNIPVRKAGKPEAIAYLAGPCRDRPDPVHIRLGVDDRIIEVSRDRLTAWMKHVDIAPGTIVAGLKKHFKATEHARVNLAAGASVAGGREHIIRIPVPLGSPFADELYKHAQIGERPPAEEEPEADAQADVTAVVTQPFVKAPEPGKPEPKETGLTAAVKQAAQDLKIIRDQEAS